MAGVNANGLILREETIELLWPSFHTARGKVAEPMSSARNHSPTPTPPQTTTAAATPTKLLLFFTSLIVEKNDVLRRLWI